MRLMKDLHNLKNSFFKLFDIDLKNLSANNKKALYYNIFFPGAGFFYGKNIIKGILIGGSSVLFVCAGILTIGKNFPNFLLIGVSLFGMAIFLHLVSILLSTKITISEVNTYFVYLYIILSMIAIFVCLLFMLKDLIAITNSAPFYLQ